MSLSYIEYNGFHISSLGLGCSRFGSMMGATKKEAEALIQLAIERGITVFDTASSYGQGDSERILSHSLGRNDQLCLVTKIGKQVPLKAKILQPVKGVVRKFGRRSNKVGSQVRQSRGGALPVCFDLPFLRKEMDRSRRRLGMDCIPMVMLHSVTEDVLQKHDAVGFLESEREKGNIRIVGVSVDDLSAAEATLDDDRITVIQTPFYDGDAEMVDWARRAMAKGKLVVAREIFHGIQTLPDTERKKHIQRNLKRATENDAISVSLVGTTKLTHLTDILSMTE